MFKQSLVKFDRKRKLDLLIGKVAAKMAKDNNDPLYRKYARLRKGYFAIKAKINAKYGARARKAAMRIAMSSKNSK